MNVRDDIEDAMQRLLEGQPRYTDGRLTRTNLAIEAGVGRATLYRHPDLISEWNRRIVQFDCSENAPLTGATIDRLVRQLDEERRRRRESERMASGLALVVAELYRTLEGMQHNGDAATRILPVHLNAASDE